MRSYYNLLGVSRDASTEEIEDAYRQKLKETHPDVSDDEHASERTKQLIEAKETLTDEGERRRYDRVGHEHYVGSESFRGRSETSADTTHRANHTQSDTDRSDRGRRGSGNRRSAGRRHTGGHGQGRGTGHEQQRATRREHNSRQSGAGRRQRTSSRRNDSSRQGRAGTWNDDAYTTDGEWTDSWRAWDTEGSYAVRRGENSIRQGRLFSSKQTLSLLGVTVLVYPVVLFGALLPTFPLPVNIAVATCAVLIVAFLQSVPDVGVVVFGVWTVLLPIVLWYVFSVSLLSPIGGLALVGVVFPLVLSLLTYRFVRPIRIE